MSQPNTNLPTSRKKVNPDNIPPNGDDPDKRKNRLNPYWLYGVIFLSVIAYTLWGKASSGGIEINPVHYKEILAGGDVVQDKAAAKEKTGIVVVPNKNIVRLYLKKENLLAKSSFYRSFLNEDEYTMLTKTPVPQVYFSIVKDLSLIHI